MLCMHTHMLRISLVLSGRDKVCCLRHGYYNTFRSSNFVHDSWKKKLSLEQIGAIERGCKEFMERNGYSAFV